MDSSEDSIVIYRATVNYTSANTEELSYQKEDILEVYVPKTVTGTALTSGTGGWYQASNTRTKKNGYVQLQNLQRCNDSSTSSNSNSMTSPSASHYLSVTGLAGDTSASNGSGNVATSAGSNGTSNSSTGSTANSGSDPSGGGDGASTVAAVTTVVSTMANLTITKSSKDSSTLVVNMTPTVGHHHHGGGGDPYAVEDIYVPCVNPSTGGGLETHN